MDKNELIYDLKRFDLSDDNSLRPHNAADEYLLSEFKALKLNSISVAIYNDRFGFLSCYLNAHDPISILTHKSQQKAIEQNLEANKLKPVKFTNPISELDEAVNLTLVKLSKSLGLYELFLQHIHQNSTEDVHVIVGFMTRHFSPKLIEISEKYFDNVNQSRSLKKSRVVYLSRKKKLSNTNQVNSIEFADQRYKQYSGVFSANHIDYATQFFLKHLKINSNHYRILDLASGNGVIAAEINREHPSCELHLMDDYFLAVESAKMNVEGDNIFHHFNNDLSIFDESYFDLIVTNPPFHFEYEINIKIPLTLFKQCHRCLKVGGMLKIVANKHLNYKTHLKPIFSVVEILAENEKFIVYNCIK